MTSPTLVLCDHCQANFVMKFEVVEHEDFVEVGMNCPHCANWTHAYFINGELSRRVAILKKEREIANRLPGKDRLANLRSITRLYERDFRAYNQAMRDKMGIERPLPEKIS